MAVKVGKYHLFQRRQDTGTFWYYWFYDEANRQIQRSCGHGCKELIEIRKRPDDMRKERNEIALMFGTMFCVTVSAGLRSLAN